MLVLLTPHGPRPVEAMLFDMDGTMIDSMDFHMRSWVKLLDCMDALPDAIETTVKTFGQTNRKIIPQLCAGKLTLGEIDALSDKKEEIYRDLSRGRVKPIPGLFDLIKRATSAGVRLGIASSAPKANIDFALEELNLGSYFSSIAHSGRVSRGKPDPETMLLGARDLSAAPMRTAVFEDAAVGLEAARRAGMIPVAIETHPHPALADWADLIVEDFFEALEVFRG